MGTERAKGASVLVAIAAALSACGRSERLPFVDERPALVVWIEVDTLRADALGAYGALGEALIGTEPSPAIDRLASDGVLFEHCYSTAPWTIPSLVSQFTGRWPFEHGATRLLEPLPESFVMLPEVLRADGWRTAGVGTNFVATGQYGFDQGFDRWDDSLALGHEGSTADAAVELLLAQLDAFADPGPESPVFLFALLFEPHFRYERHARLRYALEYDGPLTGKEELNELRAMLDEGQLTEADLAWLRALYAGEVATVDAALATLRSGLEERGLFDECLLVFTADHGEELGERGWIGHTTSLSDALVRVPLVVKPPATWDVERGRRVGSIVSQVDLARTVLDWSEVPDERRGEHLSRPGSFASLLGEAGPPARRLVYTHTRFEPVLDSAVAKRAHRFAVTDSFEGVTWEVDHQVAEGERPRGTLRRGSESLALDGGHLPEEYAYLANLRGLTGDPLNGSDGSEPVPAPLPPEVPSAARVPGSTE
ncbi:MAG: sulfatase [Planctomycetota bacterium]|jgi:arylsulfatase A-like enzyme